MKDNNNNKMEKPAANQKLNEKAVINNDAITKLAGNLFKDNQSINMGAIMNMATNLLKDDKLMDSVIDLAKMNQNKDVGVSEETPKQENEEMTSQPSNTEELTNGLTMLKQELQDFKEQNELLKEMTSQLLNTKELTNGLTMLKQELQDIKKQNQLLKDMILKQKEWQIKKESERNNQLGLLMKEIKKPKKLKPVKKIKR